MIISGVGGGLFLILLVSIAYYTYVHQCRDTNEMSGMPRSVDLTEIAIGNVSLPNVKEFEKLDKYEEKDGSKSKMS